MGIPAYFSHIIKEYKQIILSISKNNIKFDNLFLDSNSIIYDIIRSFKLEHYKTIDDYEKDIIKAVCVQIKIYIDLIKPSDITFIAFDGVAPVAKMNQQRNRRYQSEFQKNVMSHLNKDDNNKKNKTINNNPKLKEWNTSSITPGTEFMGKLSKFIHTFFKDKKVIISDSFEEGEGEHKIFEYIRENLKAPKHEKKSIIYGLDSDLIMLTLNHLHINRHLYLFRETPHFIKTIDKTLDPNELYVLDIPKFETSITQELQANPKQSSIKDYIFISFLLGNDFIPHFPALNIRTNGIDYIIDAYKKTISTRCCLINDQNEIQWKHFRKMMEYLAKNEYHYLKKEYDIREKQERKYKRLYANLEKKENLENKFEVLPILDRKKEYYIDVGKKQWEYRYYKILFDMDPTKEKIKSICMNYLEALEWTFKYYTSGCINWRWSYHYHYSPLLKDLLIYVPYFNTNLVKQTSMKAVSPYTQLSYVLPESSSYLLPKRVKEKLLIEKPSYYAQNKNPEFAWSFCKYFWESHLKLAHTDVENLDNMLRSI